MDPNSANLLAAASRGAVFSLPLGIISIFDDDPIPSVRRRHRWSTRRAKKGCFRFGRVPGRKPNFSLADLADSGLDLTVPPLASTSR
jgi:hypothetical protein